MGAGCCRWIGACLFRRRAGVFDRRHQAMNEGYVVLTLLPQSDGRLKNRPAVVLRRMPPFGDLLVCGISTQLHQKAVGFDELIDPRHPDFSTSGLKAPSLIRLGFLAVLPPSSLVGTIGAISPERHRRLLRRLGQHLTPDETARRDACGGLGEGRVCSAWRHNGFHVCSGSRTDRSSRTDYCA
ncbi:MAG: type II toxin-antitoxin system PemK/MazF family toxin [Gammaproteobacteria bacterium]